MELSHPDAQKHSGSRWGRPPGGHHPAVARTTHAVLSSTDGAGQDHAQGLGQKEEEKYWMFHLPAEGREPEKGQEQASGGRRQAATSRARAEGRGRCRGSAGQQRLRRKHGAASAREGGSPAPGEPARAAPREQALWLLFQTIPYVGTISEQLQPGSLVVIRGHVPSDSDRFQVDLQCGSSVKPRADVAFHFNPRFKRANCIVCNTLKNEKWGWEEITYDMPFTKEKSFEIVIMALKDKFQVAVNGKHVLLYSYRTSPEKIDTLGISGKVNIHSVGFRFSSDLRSGQACNLELRDINRENVHNSGMSQLTLPFAARLNTPMGPGRTVVIKGEVNANAKGFNVDLISGKSKDIALHLNPRLNSKAFVRNSFLQESWGEEERSITCFPFSPGMYFEMIVYCDAREFKVAINGVHSLEYRHRFKELGDIDTLEIDGDIHLLQVRSW
ncbi:PREDICTED: galectin-8 isoform X1 [Condylura cristata]|uniref:galectin-8 isoform X1 n=1 Tax=Condylura cristata TaxID=143302 RepID=UPI0006434851|nr:PREDICTED: galectin-8 isoform X1 [Condylura cristata]